MNVTYYTYGTFTYGTGTYGYGPALTDQEEQMIVKYNTEDQKVYTSLIEYGDVNLLSTTTFVIGDTQISIDDTPYQNTVNIPSISNSKVSLTLDKSETVGQQIQIRFKDLTNPPIWTDKVISIETYGNSSAYISDPFDATANVTEINGTPLLSATLNLKQLVIDNYSGGPAVDIHTVGGEASLLIASDGGAAIKAKTNSGAGALVLNNSSGPVVNMNTSNGPGFMINSTNGPALDLTSNGAPGIVVETAGGPPAVYIQSSGDALILQSDNGNGINIQAALNGMIINSTSGYAASLHSTLSGGFHVDSYGNAIDLVPVIGNGIGINTTQGQGSGIRIDGLRGFDSNNTNESIRLASHNRAIYIDANNNANGIVIEAAGNGIMVNAQENGVVFQAPNGAGLLVDGEVGMVIGGEYQGIVMNGGINGVSIGSTSGNAINVVSTSGDAFYLSGAPNMKDIRARELNMGDVTDILSGVDYIISEIDNSSYGLSAIKNKTDTLVTDILGANIDSMTLSDAITKIMSWAIGDVNYLGNGKFVYYQQDNSTSAFGLSATDSNRMRF